MRVYMLMSNCVDGVICRISSVDLYILRYVSCSSVLIIIRKLDLTHGLPHVY